jgi:DNA-binding MarR family transcriptional regulator
MRRARFDNGAADPVGSVLRLANTLIRDLSPVFEKAKITPQQWMLLTMLESIGEEPTLAGLARNMMVSKQNVTTMVRRLVDAGLVRKSNDVDDLRSSRVALTRKGSELVERVRPAYDQWVKRFFEGLEDGERSSFHASVETLLELSGNADR